MKIFVFSDLHGSVKTMEQIFQAIQREQPNKVVFCGDLFGGWKQGTTAILEKIRQIDAVVYLVRGNNDIFYQSAPCDFEEYAVMYHFGRMLFFTHGHIYNGYHLPAVIGQGDVLVHGHTHTTRFSKSFGVHVVNVGSCSQPRDNIPCYLILDDIGATQKTLKGVELYTYKWVE